MGCGGCTKTKSMKYLEHEKYIILDEKEGGAFGKIFKIMSNITNIEYIAKIVKIKNPTPEKMKKAYLEVEILKTCHHPNIILLKDVFKQKSGNEVTLNIITEYCDDGDLENKVKEQKNNKKHFEETQLIMWLMQICLALKHLHKKLKIIHRDIKPSNIFLTSKGYVKLGDFGLSKIFDNNNKEKDNNDEGNNQDKLKKYLKGTSMFMSPEILVYQEYTEKSDIWALGVTFYYLMNFKYPFEGRNNRELFDRIVFTNAQPNSELNSFSYYSKEFIDLIERMLSKKPENRPTAEMILEEKVIKDKMAPFLKNNNFNSKKVSKFIEEYEKQKKINKNNEKKNEKNRKQKNEDFIEENLLNENTDNIQLTKEEIKIKEEEKKTKEKYEMNKIMNYVHDCLEIKN